MTHACALLFLLREEKAFPSLKEDGSLYPSSSAILCNFWCCIRTQRVTAQERKRVEESFVLRKRYGSAREEHLLCGTSR
ncbi:unnamed protein product [Lasius platythorax]|uniref:Uncharacterized protein n=1 Tax=Lasius platythorax TaxID=488582 RepID=A0AAV2P4M2_9HYME